MGIFIFRALIDCRKTDFFAGSWRQLDRWENSACLCARAWKAAALPTVDVPHSFSCHCFSGGELGERSALLSSFLENRWCVRDPAETYLRPHTPATSSITAAALLTKSKRRGAKGGLDREEEPTIGLAHWEAARPPALFNTLIYLTGPWTSPGVQKCCLSRFLLPFKLTASSWTVPRIIQQANRNTQSPLLFFLLNSDRGGQRDTESSPLFPLISPYRLLCFPPAVRAFLLSQQKTMQVEVNRWPQGLFC